MAWQTAPYPKRLAPDGSVLELSGRSADVLHRDAGGAWRILIDNPWGAAVLDA